ncbi:MAG: hypothetical protein VXY53_08360, partial [Candidatus Thermoplasmatota archaeon]|nr:hypothetical protein [Candidatus Thermoplasmatota archaeon]
MADLVSTSAGDLSAEVVTVDDGSGGVRTTLQITSANGTTPQVELELRSDVETTESTVETSAFVSTVEIPTDVGELSQSAQLDVNISGDGFPAIQFEHNIPSGQPALQIAQELLQQIVNRLGVAAQETVDVRIETGEAGDVSLVLQSSAGPITTDIDFETTSFSTTGSQSFASVDLPSEISQGDELGLEVTGSGAAVNLTQTVADGETIEQVADRLVADLVSTSAGDLSAEVVTV